MKQLAAITDEAISGHSTDADDDESNDNDVEMETQPQNGGCSTTDSCSVTEDLTGTSFDRNGDAVGIFHHPVAILKKK